MTIMMIMLHDDDDDDDMRVPSKLNNNDHENDHYHHNNYHLRRHGYNWHHDDGHHCNALYLSCGSSLYLEPCGRVAFNCQKMRWRGNTMNSLGIIFHHHDYHHHQHHHHHHHQHHLHHNHPISMISTPGFLGDIEADNRRRQRCSCSVSSHHKKAGRKK